MPVCFGVVVWVAGTVWVVIAARRARARRPNEIPQIAVVIAGIAAASIMVMVGGVVTLMFAMVWEFLVMPRRS